MRILYISFYIFFTVNWRKNIPRFTKLQTIMLFGLVNSWTRFDFACPKHSPSPAQCLLQYSERDKFTRLIVLVFTLLPPASYNMDLLGLPLTYIEDETALHSYFNPLSPHDALKHPFTFLKTDVIFLQLKVSEGKFQ